MQLQVVQLLGMFESYPSLGKPFEPTRPVLDPGAAPVPLVVIVATLLILVVGTLFGLLAYLVVPGRRNVPIWAAILLGMAAMVLGSLLANLFGVGDTQGVDWMELLLQLALAIAGVTIVTALRSRRRAS